MFEALIYKLHVVNSKNYLYNTLQMEAIDGPNFSQTFSCLDIHSGREDFELGREYLVSAKIITA